MEKRETETAGIGMQKVLLNQLKTWILVNFITSEVYQPVWMNVCLKFRILLLNNQFICTV